MKTTVRTIATLLCVLTLVSAVSCKKEETGTTADTADTTASELTYSPSEDSTSETPQTDDSTNGAQSGTDTDGESDGGSVTDTDEVPTEDTSTSPAEDTLPGETTEDGTSSSVTLPSDTPTDTPTDTSSSVTSDVQTNPVETTTAAPVPTERTKTPTVLGVYNCAPDRAIIYGKCEEGSILTSRGSNGLKERNKAGGEYFYIEHSTGSKNDKIRLYATVPGKLDSQEVTATVSYNANVEMNVFGGKNSRLIYQHTITHMLGQVRAEQNMLTYLKNYLIGVRADICKATGKDTKMIYVIAPNPGTVYSDEMRDYILDATGGEKKLTAAWQFVNTMQGVDGFIVPDLYTLYDGLKDEDIFYRTDTHWSELGAFYAYREVMTSVKNDFSKTKVYSLSDFNVVYEDCPAGDMASMLGTGDMREQTPFFYPKFSNVGAYYGARRATGKSLGSAVGAYPATSSITGTGLPTCYFIGDSYGANFLPFAGMSFGEMYANKDKTLWSYALDYSLIAEEKPDYVMYIYTDRNIGADLGILFS